MADVVCAGCGAVITTAEDPGLGDKLTAHIIECDTHDFQKPCTHDGDCWTTVPTPNLNPTQEATHGRQKRSPSKKPLLR